MNSLNSSGAFRAMRHEFTLLCDEKRELLNRVHKLEV
jgi:hypothetical protein